MTLPAKILLSVSSHVYPRNLFGGGRALCMALATELPVLHTLRPVPSWIYLMFLGDLMAHSTLETVVSRKNDDALYLSMAGIAPCRDVGWFRVVRLMASYTGLNRVMRI
jgi:hypothetical protein